MGKRGSVWRYLVNSKQLFSISYNRERTLYQLIRYVVVGLTQNGIGYLVYLFLTWVLALDPKLVVAVTYPLGVLISYAGNAKFTFGKKVKDYSMVFKYFISHCMGYCLNISLLYIFVDIYSFSHEIVQFFCIFLVATLLFLLSKFFVFTSQFKVKVDE